MSPRTYPRAEGCRLLSSSYHDHVCGPLCPQPRLCEAVRVVPARSEHDTSPIPVTRNRAVFPRIAATAALPLDRQLPIPRLPTATRRVRRKEASQTHPATCQFQMRVRSEPHASRVQSTGLTTSERYVLPLVFRAVLADLRSLDAYTRARLTPRWPLAVPRIARTPCILDTTCPRVT